jgi:signal transduction histidine kinase
MLATFFCLFLGLIGGLVAASSIPTLLYADLGQFLSTIILDPFSFLIGMFFFFIGFLANAKLFRGCIELTYAYFKGVRIYPFQILSSYLVIFNFVLVFILNPIVGLLFLVFSCMYGMISLKINRYIPYVQRMEL